VAKGRKTGGRTKGTPNRRKVETRVQLQDYLDSQGVNAFAVIVATMQSTTDERVRVQCAQVLLDRLMPRLKAVEISGAPEQPLHVQWTPAQRQARIAVLLEHQRNGQAESPP